jgi:hypothetical protein
VQEKLFYSMIAMKKREFYSPDIQASVVKDL